MKDNTVEIISKVLVYINDIEVILQNHDYSYDEYVSNIEFKHSVNMCLLQIGELAKLLDRDLVKEHAEAGWREAIGLRNIVAHGYGTLKNTLMWKTLNESIPILKEDAEAIMKQCVEYEANKVLDEDNELEYSEREI